MDKFNYQYDLPENLIAKHPMLPRDAARLLMYDTATDVVKEDIFANLDIYLPEGVLLVMNDTKVVPARIDLFKVTGGRVEALFLVNEWNGAGSIPTLLSRGVNTGARLQLAGGKSFKVVSQSGKIFELQPEFEAHEIWEILDNDGKMPIPKYIKGSTLSESELRQEYQSVFGKQVASVAAPTASLHFTSEVLRRCEKRNIQIAFITLHVGLGTFAPLTAQNLRTNKLHRERFQIRSTVAQSIKQYKDANKPVVAVGTTVTRALEAAASEILDSRKSNNADLVGMTDIFIRPSYQFKIVDALITNFHLPASSLMMMVQALLAQKRAQRSLVELYELAVNKQYRFYSFGDGMLIK